MTNTDRTSSRAVTMFRAGDDTLWSTDEEAAKRDALLAAIGDALAPLKPVPRGGFKGYVQQDRDAVLRAKATLLKLADAATDGWISKTWDIADPAKVANRGILLRVIGDMDGPIARAWGRLTCIDDACREWEQPYFAANPGTGEDRCIG